MLALMWPEWLTFNGIVKAVTKAITSALVAILSFIWNGLKTVLMALFEFIWSFVGEYLQPIFGPFKSAYLAVESFVTQLWDSLSALHVYFDFVNAWVPLDLFFQLAAAYSILWVAFFTYRTVKSWIPMVSGGG